MIELTWIPEALRLLVWVYLALAVAAIYFALTKPRSTMAKGLWTLGAVAAFAALPLSAIYKDRTVNQPVREAHQEKLKAAMQRFEMRCKSAGEKIARTVDNVDGVVWMKWRPQTVNSNSQFEMTDPYGYDCGGEACIKLLLRATRGLEIDPDKKMPFHKGYQYLESVDPENGKMYRYVLQLSEGNLDHQVLVREKIQDFAGRYGITWDDISTKEDREYWIAGSSLKLIDLQSNEVIAERVGYMMDRELGNQAGFRSPWLFAEYTACPAFDQSESKSPIKTSRSRDFVRKVLKATQGE